MKKMEVMEQLSEDQVKELLAQDISKSAKVKVLFDHGFEVKDIANLLKIRYNFAYNVIQNYVVVNGIAVETAKKETKKDAVYALFEQGKTLGEVSKELKMNYNYVWKLHKEWERAAAAEVEQAEGAK
jgi:hypothetical protein